MKEIKIYNWIWILLAIGFLIAAMVINGSKESYISLIILSLGSLTNLITNKKIKIVTVIILFLVLVLNYILNPIKG